MLSILIPIYNFKVVRLVQDLHQQCETCAIPYEIIGFDDGSTAEFKAINKEIGLLNNVIYKELPQNLGRAKIRNHLAKSANYQYLLFMDCDSKVRDNQYIKNYIQHLQPTTLLYGGRIYAASPPNNKGLKLHYFFGKHREEILTEERKLKPYYSFMTNNFLMPKALFLDIQFEESIEGYGHEDTLFGIALKQQKIPILHLNNPLEHIGLEEWNVFLKKQRTAIKNLYVLHQQEPLLETKLLTTFVACKKWKMAGLVLLVLQFLKPIIQQQLKAEQPNLFFLDLFKLHHLLSLDKYGIDHLPS
ncbi:MAG: glycosyltransferase family 2 protein [Saprospiraceae bacterium]